MPRCKPSTVDTHKRQFLDDNDVDADVDIDVDHDESSDTEDEEDTGVPGETDEEAAEEDGEEEEEEEDADGDADDTRVVYDDLQPKRRGHLHHTPSLYAQILTKNEKTALIGFRAQQIVSGAEVYVETHAGDSPFDIAERELHEKKLPYAIRRHMPDGTSVYTKIDNLLDLF